jgi:UDP-glucose 4-epimerase
MKIVVTGGSGFIGSYIVDELSKDKKNKIYIFDIVKPDFNVRDNVKYIDGDICYKTSIDKATEGASELYDCAGVLGTHELVFQTERAIDTNIKGAFNIIQSCIDNKVKRIFHPTKPYFKTHWENTYTISKITAENFCRMFREVYNMDITILRWMNASGPRQHLFPVRKFVPLVICQALLNKDIQIYGTGKQTVDIIDVRDIAKIAIKAVRSGLGKSKEVLDVGSGQAISCNDLAKKIVKMTTSKSKIIHVPMRIGEAVDTNIVAKTHERLFKQLEYKTEYTLDDTIQNCIDYTKSLGEEYLLKAFNFYKK